MILQVSSLNACFQTGQNCETFQDVASNQSQPTWKRKVCSVTLYFASVTPSLKMRAALMHMSRPPYTPIAYSFSLLPNVERQDCLQSCTAGSSVSCIGKVVLRTVPFDRFRFK